MAMAWSLLGVNVVSMVMNWLPNRRLLSYSFGELLADVLPAAVTAGGIGMALMWLIAGDGVGGMRIL